MGVPVLRIVARGYVGKKGEIYIGKKARELLGVKPGDELIVYTRDNELVIRKAPKLEDILRKKPLATISVREIEEISDEEQRKYT